MPHKDGVALEPVDPEAAVKLRLALWAVPAVVLDEVATVSLLPRIAAASAANPGVMGEDQLPYGATRGSVTPEAVRRSRA